MTPQTAAESLKAMTEGVYVGHDDVTVTLVPGQIVTDDWCWGGCGTAYVRLDTVYPSVDFPIPMTRPAPTPSQVSTVARFHVGVHRCVHGLSNDGRTPPSPVEQTTDALALLDDAWLLYCALTRWVKDEAGRGGGLLGGWTPVGPLGDCAGGFWAVTIRL